MPARNLADAVEALVPLASERRPLRGRDGAVLNEAAYRLRIRARMRDALADRVAEVIRIRRDLERLRAGRGGAAQTSLPK